MSTGALLHALLEMAASLMAALAEPYGREPEQRLYMTDHVTGLGWRGVLRWHLAPCLR